MGFLEGVGAKWFQSIFDSFYVLNTKCQRSFDWKNEIIGNVFCLSAVDTGAHFPPLKLETILATFLMT